MIIPAFDQTVIPDLEMADMIVSMETDLALTSRLGLYAIQWTFHNSAEREKLFKNNPINTLGGRLLKSSLEKAAMDVYSQTSDFVKMAKIDWSNIIGLVTLRNHRTFHAHTYVSGFNDNQVREFVEADGHYKDDIALRVWQVRSSLIQLLLKNKCNVKVPLRVEYGPELIDIVYDIFHHSCRDMGKLQPAAIDSILKMFSVVLMGKYAESFQDDFRIVYEEGPYAL